MNNVSRPPSRMPVTIICVSNDVDVLNACLQRSVDEAHATAPRTELIVIQNTDNRFDTAGAALNFGVRQARNAACVFVHQDVFLHSLARLEEAAAHLSSHPEEGLVGAIGIDRGRILRGQVRDRMIVSGTKAESSIAVESLDEVLFMATTRQLREEPLSEDSELAWHAYAVEYGARMRRLGKSVSAVNIPLTHNSLTINLALLTEAHEHVARLYPELTPLMTTCGVIGGERTRTLPRLLESNRWRLRWLKASWRAYKVRKLVNSRRLVLADIRFDLDVAMERAGVDRLSVTNVCDMESIDQSLGNSIQLPRRGRQLTFRAMSIAELVSLPINDLNTGSQLFTNLNAEDLSRIEHKLTVPDRLIGFDQAIGFWFLTGPITSRLPDAWQQRSARPLGVAQTI